MEDSQNWYTMAGRSGQYNLQGYATIEDRAVTSYVHVHVLSVTSMCSHLIPSGCLCRRMKM